MTFQLFVRFFAGKIIHLIKLKEYSIFMLGSLFLYNGYPIQMVQQFYQQSQVSKSNKSGKISTRKGSTDIDSRTKFKTQVCKYWINSIDCPYGDNCNFAHGDVQVRNKETLPSKYKTRCCHKFNDEGFCSYGYRCQFIHCSYKQSHLLHEDQLNCLSSDSQVFFNFLEERQRIFGKSQRLPIFQKICDNNGITGAIKEEQAPLEDQDNQLYENHVDIRSRHNSF